MTKFARLLCAILLIVSAFLMFVPVATFEDNSAAALQEEIDKQVGRLESEQAKLQRYVDQVRVTSLKKPISSIRSASSSTTV